MPKYTKLNQDPIRKSFRIAMVENTKRILKTKSNQRYQLIREGKLSLLEARIQLVKIKDSALLNAHQLKKKFQKYDAAGLKIPPINASNDDRELEEHFGDELQSEHPLSDTAADYDPVIGECLNKRYTVLKKLGSGAFSTVWLCRDGKDNTFGAHKIQKSEYYKESLKEIEYLTQLSKNPIEPHRERIVNFLDSFKIIPVQKTTQKVNHTSMVFEVMGQNLLEKFIEAEQGIHINNVKSITRQILEGLDYLHRKCNIIHSDLKPENILVCLDDDEKENLTKEWNSLFSEINVKKSNDIKPIVSTRKMDTRHMLKQLKEKPKGINGLKNFNCVGKISCDRQKFGNNVSGVPEGRKLIAKKPDPTKEICNIKIKIADLGNSFFGHENESRLIQSREYRSIEVLIGADYEHRVDIWSTACIAFELATSNFLFDLEVKDESLLADVEHLKLINNLLGPIPKKVVGSCKRSDLSECFDKPTNPRQLYKILLQEFGCTSKEQEARKFAEFLLSMLDLDQYSRPTASACLKNQWLQF